MAAKENRFVRIEDWKGNRYFPQTSNSGSTAGSVVDSSDLTGDPSRPPYSDGSITADPQANGGSAIILTADPVEQKKLFVADIANVPFGAVSINVRMKSSISKTNVELIQINTYFVDMSAETPVAKLLDSAKYTGYSFKEANQYTNLAMFTEYRGVATSNYVLRVEIIVLPGTGGTFYYDQLAVAMEMSSKADADDIHVEGDTVVVPVSNKNIHVDGYTVVVP